MMVGVNIGREQLELIAHRTIKDADEDIDDCIDFEEFKKVYREMWLACVCTLTLTAPIFIFHSKVMANEEIEAKMTVRFLN